MLEYLVVIPVASFSLYYLKRLKEKMVKDIFKEKDLRVILYKKDKDFVFYSAKCDKEESEYVMNNLVNIFFSEANPYIYFCDRVVVLYDNQLCVEFKVGINKQIK